jgi:hypothetical protein
MVRIKIFDQSGTLLSVVAPPDLFTQRGDDAKAPEVCADANGVIYALDFERGMVRVFEPLEQAE